MLRTATPDKYDQWVSNELPFNSPEVLNAMEIYGQFSRNDDYVAGGAASVATTFFGDAPKGLYLSCTVCDAPSGVIHPRLFSKEGEEVTTGEADFFYFPPFEKANLGNPVLGAKTLIQSPRIHQQHVPSSSI